MFGKKLSYLMLITNTKNNELANAIPLSVSCISRWKNGKRKPTKNSTYIKIIAKYFYNKISELKLEYLFDDISCFNSTTNFINNLEYWLKDDNVSLDNNSITISSIPESIFYYGDDGKRTAVLRFLNNFKNKTNQTLLLYSDESMSWMMDNDFAQKWSILLQEILKNNNKIKIIHTITREYNEIFDAISKWLPLYLCGHIEPYYFQKLRDGITKTTLFIGQTEAIYSSSVENNTKSMLNTYINDKTAISSLRSLFNNYLSLCKPLLNIINGYNENDRLSLYNPNNHNLIVDSYSLSYASIPEDVLLEFLKIKGYDNRIKYYLNKKNILINNLKEYSILDIIHVKRTFSNNIPTIFMDKVFYSKENYIKHLENIIYMLENYENYSVILKFDSLSDTCIYIKEDTEIIIEKNQSDTVLISNETNIIRAFYEHYSKIKIESKNETIKKLVEIISNIKLQ